MNALQELKALLRARENQPLPESGGSKLSHQTIIKQPAPVLTEPANEPQLEPVDWRLLHHAYMVHAINCPACRAAGKGYGQRCTTGLSLWRYYEAAPDDARPAVPAKKATHHQKDKP